MDKSDKLCVLYAPVYTGKREVVRIIVKSVRVLPDRKTVFINGQHYSDVFRTEQDAIDYWTRNRHVKPLSIDEITNLVKREGAQND